jgi:hypothetical protein
MDTTDTKNSSKINGVFRKVDYFAFTVLMIFLVLIVISSSRANIQTDSIDYYAIVQRLTHNSGNPIVRNLHFVEQRSPGYPIITLIPYYLISSVVEPFVKTETITTGIDLGNSPPSIPPSERMILPNKPLLSKDIFFKNFYVETQDSWFEWRIISSMLLTSYALLLIGLVFIMKSLALENKPVLGASLAPLVIITSNIFMHNIVNTPAYATLTAFGFSCLFGYFFAKASLEKNVLAQFLSGLFVGLLVLTRLETVVIAIVVLISLFVIKEISFLKNYVLGGLIALAILLIYNFTQYGNLFHLGTLKGDINLISFNWGFIYNNLLNPRSGILFWSTLTSLGIIGLFLGKKRYTIILGISSLALIVIVLIRVPVMYYCIGEGTRLIGGLPITCPNNLEELVDLIRFDANRYIVVVIPFAIVGLRTFVVSAIELWQRKHQVLNRKKKAGEY